MVLFIWGPGRIVPVRVTGLTITRNSTNRAQPDACRGQLTLRVLTPDELDGASQENEVLASLATNAYTYTYALRQGLALANLANAAISDRMIPH